MSRRPLLSGTATGKGLRADAQRAVTPEETLDRVRPLFGRIGLTRLADITGLDSVGIPVVLSVRPQSGYLSVDGGKGFTPAAAAASAAMECFERHAGEQTPVECFTSPHADLPEEARIEVSDLPLSRNSLFSTRSPQVWTWAEDLLGELRHAGEERRAAGDDHPGGEQLLEIAFCRDAAILDCSKRRCASALRKGTPRRCAGSCLQCVCNGRPWTWCTCVTLTWRWCQSK